MEKVAIIGLSCLFPGADNPEQFWQNLVEEKDTTSSATAEKMGIDPAVFYDPKSEKPDCYYCLKGGFIKDFTFDTAGYAISPEFIEGLDDVFKWSLYGSKQALQDSGYWDNQSALAKCGVILGNLSAPTKLSQQIVSPIYRKTVNRALQELLGQAEFKLGSLPCPNSPLNIFTAAYPTTVVAQALSLGGIHFSLDAACSSALYAIKLACQYLRSHKADLMLAGAVSCADPFVNHMGFSLLRAFPQDGISRPLDRSSSGLLTGEGAGMLALKRYDDAVRDGDKIYATILGVGLSNDGKGKYFVSPNPKGQILAFQRTYAEAELDPQSIDYIECHATGTDLGDKTELHSMETFFGQYGATPLIGSVKSNLGHLLTAAGMPSLIKVILSMSKGLIPPTINLRDPLNSPNNLISASQIVREAVPWANTPRKRAAVSAFGFGGTNAHLVLEAGEVAESKAAEVKEEALDSIAIVGMDAFFGGCDGLDAFERSIYEGKQHFIPVPPERWKGIEDEQLLKDYGFTDGSPKGAYIQDFEIDFLKFKIPPKPTEQPIPQQLLLLKVADRAIRDAGLKPGGNVAVIIAMETDLTSHQYRARCDFSWQLREGLAGSNISLSSEKLSELETIVKESIHVTGEVGRSISYIGNIMACRISALWDFNGPSFTLSAQENSVFKALEVAQLFLSQQQVDAVVVGAVDLAGGVENVLLRNQGNLIGSTVGEGAGAVVLKRLESAKEAQNQIYAAIDAISLVQDVSTSSASAVENACQQAFKGSSVKPCDIGYLEIFGSGVPHQDEAEINGLVQAYQTQSRLSCAIGSVKANIGHTYAASGIASLIKTALCLYYQYIPAQPQWSGPKHPEVWQGSPFYVATESRPWSLAPKIFKRTAALNGLGLDGTYAHILLSENLSQTKRSSRYLEQTPFYLFPIAANNHAALLDLISSLQQTITDCSSLAQAASQAFAKFDRQAAYKLAIVGHNKDELNSEIERSRPGISKAFSGGGDWQTPLRSYFTTNPLGKHNDIAFVYPGAFTSYIGMFRDLHRLFPHNSRFSYPPSLKKFLHLSNQFIYPRSLNKLTPSELEHLEADLRSDGQAISTSGTIVAFLLTKMIRDYFQIQPKSAFGYSFGEVGMLIALDIWTNADQFLARAETSSVWKTRVSGPKMAIREAWGIPPTEKQTDENLWNSYLLMCSPSQVRERLQNERVYLTHINTHKEVVIGGDPQGCLRVIEALKCNYFPAPGAIAVHCEPMHSEYEQLVKWLTLPVPNHSPVKFYSAADYQALTLNSQAIANKLAQVICQPVDFPRLINRCYEDGDRIFIELGSGKSCTRWISETLKDKAHLALYLDSGSADVHNNIVRLLAKLLSHQVAVDLAPLYPQAQKNSLNPKSLVKDVTVGGCRIRSTILTEENRLSFATQRERGTGSQKSKVKISSAPLLPIFREAISVAQSPRNLEEAKANHNPTHSTNFQVFHQKLNDHAAYLQARQELLRQMSHIEIEQQASPHKLPSAQKSALRGSRFKQAQSPQNQSLSLRSPDPKPAQVVFDQAEVLEVARGKLSRVFGKEYSIIDSYPRCTRVPMPPYLFISRVTKLNAKRGCFEPCSIETEYDIPKNAWYSKGGQIPCAVAIEASHANIFLLSYLGIDFEYSQRVYRALNGSTTWLGNLPQDGQTLRAQVKINSFIRSSDTMLLFFTHNLFVGEKQILTMNLSAGFFSNKDLSKAQGITLTKLDQQEQSKIQISHFEPLLQCDKTSFNKDDIINLSLGNITACFGNNYEQNGKNPWLRLPPLPMCMIDCVTSIDPKGGAWGLGLIVGEKSLEPEHWYFNCHFKDDYCMPGTVMGEGCIQLLAFYVLYLGLQTRTVDASFQPIHHLTGTGRYSGQITPVSARLTYQLEVTEIGLSPEPFIKADAAIIFQDRIIALSKNLGIRLGERWQS